jgi:hypothetical protein
VVLDRATGDFDAANPKHQAPILTFPALHVSRHDFGDLAEYQRDKNKPPYAVFPNVKTRLVETVSVREAAGGLEMTVKDRYENFAGTVRWTIDNEGMGDIGYDYVYTGDDLDSREVGMQVRLPAVCDEIKWRRWSEWGIFPEDCICRTEGNAKAKRDNKWPDQPPNARPQWPWSQDQTELGTADFRSVKFHIYDAALVSPDGSGVQVKANADAHVRASVAKQGCTLHILSQCSLAPVTLTNGSGLTGDFNFRLLASDHEPKMKSKPLSD